MIGHRCQPTGAAEESAPSCGWRPASSLLLCLAVAPTAGAAQGLDLQVMDDERYCRGRAHPERVGHPGGAAGDLGCFSSGDDDPGAASSKPRHVPEWVFRALAASICAASA